MVLIGFADCCSTRNLDDFSNMGNACRDSNCVVVFENFEHSLHPLLTEQKTTHSVINTLMTPSTMLAFQSGY